VYSLYWEQHRHAIQQDEPMTQLAWLFAQLVESTLAVVPSGAGPVDSHQISNFRLSFIQILHHHTRKSVPPAR